MQLNTTKQEKNGFLDCKNFIGLASLNFLQFQNKIPFLTIFVRPVRYNANKTSYLVESFKRNFTFFDPSNLFLSIQLLHVRLKSKLYCWGRCLFGLRNHTNWQYFLS